MVDSINIISKFNRDCMEFYWNVLCSPIMISLVHVSTNKNLKTWVICCVLGDDKLSSYRGISRSPSKDPYEHTISTTEYQPIVFLIRVMWTEVEQSKVAEKSSKNQAATGI